MSTLADIIHAKNLHFHFLLYYTMHGRIGTKCGRIEFWPLREMLSKSEAKGQAYKSLKTSKSDEVGFKP